MLAKYSARRARSHEAPAPCADRRPARRHMSLLDSGLRHTDLADDGALGLRAAPSCAPLSVRPAAGVAARLAQASKKCKLYLNHPCTGARARLTAGGLRRTSDRRKRRWPSFIIWRWAGPDPDGWIRFRLEYPPAPTPTPPAPPEPTPATAQPSAPARPAKKAAKPAKKAARPAAKKAREEDGQEERQEGGEEAAKKTAKKSARKAARKSTKKAARRPAKKAGRKAAKKSSKKRSSRKPARKRQASGRRSAAGASGAAPGPWPGSRCAPGPRRS